jgi:large subunit ribosomal protein L15
MQNHNLKRNHKNQKRRIVGRGGKHAKTSGRGTKGQNARAGHKKRPEIRDFIKRLPKLRGRGKNINTSIEVKAFPVNLFVLEEHFKSGDSVSPKTLSEKGIVSTFSGSLPRIKILGTGTISKKLKIEGCSISIGAKAAIEKAGGTVEVK